MCINSKRYTESSCQTKISQFDYALCVNEKILWPNLNQSDVWIARNRVYSIFTSNHDGLFDDNDKITRRRVFDTNSSEERTTHQTKQQFSLIFILELKWHSYLHFLQGSLGTFSDP